MGFQLDPLSMTFVLLVTLVGGLIHVYSIGYMAHDPDKRRFFGYLNLFVASMLLLVLASSYVLVYVGWEGVGLASYLLIGFWNAKREYATAAKKAFVMNRVGDIGMSLAIMLMVTTFGTTAFSGVFSGVEKASTEVVLALGLLLLLAATGKSAQMPLQAWLGDAMAGPTPVSALIHAATMVTAGVYLIVRSNPIFDLSDGARLAVVLVGVLTLLFGAFVGTAKDDIKKALAASTMSQIGYMVLAAGLGPAGYAFAIFHLLTHGFFKAHLFLGAGSVMHGMDDEVNMRRFGALRAAMPVTFVTFLIGYLAIIGIPPFAGFFSKDLIIEAALADNVWLGVAAILGAGITAFYMTRVMILTFFGDKRWKDDAHPHESPMSMKAPMALLSVGSVVLGFVLWSGDRIVNWLEPVVGPEEHHELGIPVLAGHAHRPDRRPGRRRDRRGDVPATSGSGRGPGRFGADPGCPPGLLPGRLQRVALHATGPVPDPVPRLLRQPGGRRVRQRRGGDDRWQLGAPAPDADRVRALLRAVHACRGRPGRRCSRAGEAVT